MARVRMVTRTIESATATIMTVDTTTGTTGTTTYTVTGDVENIDILKMAKKALETDTLKLVYVMSTHTESKLYGMLETDFLKVAKELPPRTTAE